MSHLIIHSSFIYGRNQLTEHICAFAPKEKAVVSEEISRKTLCSFCDVLMGWLLGHHLSRGKKNVCFVLINF